MLFQCSAGPVMVQTYMGADLLRINPVTDSRHKR